MQTVVAVGRADLRVYLPLAVWLGFPLLCSSVPWGMGGLPAEPLLCAVDSAEVRACAPTLCLWKLTPQVTKHFTYC